MLLTKKARPWVRKAFEWYAGGIGTHVIAHRMSEGAPTQSWLTARIGADGKRIRKTKTVKAWDSNRIRKLLRQEAYRGLIVLPELFDNVQGRLASSPAYSNERKFEYPLSGAMRCLTCGRHLHGGSTRATNSKRLADGTIRKYVAKRRRLYRCAVCHFAVPADKIDADFFSAIGNLVAEPSLLKRWISEPNGDRAELAAWQKELREIEAYIHSQRIRDQRDRIFKLALAASINEVDFKAQMDRLDEEVQLHSARHTALNAKVESRLEHQRTIKQAVLLLRRFDQIYKKAEYSGKRVLVGALVDALGGLTVSREGLHWPARSGKDSSLSVIQISKTGHSN